jgi:hypothetical protein
MQVGDTELLWRCDQQRPLIGTIERAIIKHAR